MADIRMFMCCHKAFDTVPPLCEPICCGAALGRAAEGALSDNSGDNISERNSEYCELTAHYFVWKNIRAEYYGFCHYRRFFGKAEVTEKPYLSLGKISSRKYSELLGDDNYWRSVIDQYDIVVPFSENMGLPAKQHYVTSRFHYSEDMELFIELLAEYAPQLTDSVRDYLSQNRQYFCNMFIMKAEFFKSWCEILFPLLEEFDKRKSLHGDFQSDRTDGYLGEIFTGIFITYCRNNNASILEVPRIDVDCSFKKRLGCGLFPPESKRRFWAKKLVKKFRGK